MPDTITVYADYVCPFCYLGEASLERYLDRAEEAPAVEWHPFDLRGQKRGPDDEIRDDVDDGKDDAYFERVRENVARLRERYDVEMLALEDLPDDVDSWNAQLVALAVQRDHDRETFASFHDGLFAALWRDGRDVGDPAVLADVAADAGVPRATVEETLDDEDLAATLRDRFAAARRTGVTGVPTFVYGDHAARGAVPPAHLERLVAGPG